MCRRVQDGDLARTDAERFLRPVERLVHQDQVGDGQNRCQDGQPQHDAGDRLAGDAVGQQPGGDQPDGCANLLQDAEKRFIEAEPVDGEPLISGADAWRGPEREDHDRRVEDALAGFLVNVRGDSQQHQDHHGHRDYEDQLLIEGQAGDTEDGDDGSERNATAEQAPIRRSALGGFEPHQQRPCHRDQRHDQAEQKHRLVRKDLRQIARQPRDRQDAERERQPPHDLHHAQVAIDGGFVPRRAIGVFARHHLRAHGVGDDVLQYDAGDREQRGQDVNLVRRGEGDPLAGSARQQHQSSRDERGTQEHIDAPLRPKDRHGIDQLAEHHLDGPGQRQPDAEGSEILRGQGERVLDPEAVGNRRDAERPIGEVDHQQRQIGDAELPDRRNECRFYPCAPRLVRVGRADSAFRYGHGMMNSAQRNA